VSAGEGRAAELERRVAELRRVNERLGRELIEAEAGRRPAAGTPAGRAVAKLIGERDSAEAKLAELAELRPELEHLRRENPQLRAEIERLRGGYLGLLRRARARLLNR
jgi:molybdenum-dependent DNA-binding transcriptional regulator ModE